MGVSVSLGGERASSPSKFIFFARSHLVRSMYLLLLALVAYSAYLAIQRALPRYLLVPPQDWRVRIDKVLDSSTPIYFPKTTKLSSWRRRLITASSNPSFYTNFLNDRLKLAPEDCARKEAFKDALKDRSPTSPLRAIVFGFFHPYANNGGGGERVLWEAVKATLDDSPRNIAVVYTTNTDAAPLVILDQAALRFHIAGLQTRRVCFIYLRRFGAYIAAEKYPHFTLLGQLVGTLLLTWEAIQQLLPDIWVDTMGLPASYALVLSILKIPICAYVHYPIIQNEMFSKLGYRGLFSSPVVVLVKHYYWSALSFLYAYLGSRVDVSLANGSWTLDHMKRAWPYNAIMQKPVELCYPPCGLDESKQSSSPRENVVLYIAQFRPEKRHSNVLHQYKLFVDSMARKPLAAVPLLVFLGSCRSADDTATLNSVRALVAELDLAHRVQFVVDCSFEEVEMWLCKAKFGLNAMWNEHFGIGVVEYISHGTVPIVHALGGPVLDIVVGAGHELHVPTDGFNGIQHSSEHSPAKSLSQSQEGPLGHSLEKSNGQPLDDTAKEPESSCSWHNECGFFFKDKLDPDYQQNPAEQSQPGFLSFGTNVYPELHMLLKILFDKNPDLVSDHALELMRGAGKKAATRFSDSQFDQKWVSCVAQLKVLEQEYRVEKRSKVEQVY